jgi:hypothetical protein
MAISRIAEILETMAPIAVAPANQASVDAYADVAGSKIDSQGKTRVVYTILNAHAANAIKWKVLASLDDVTYIEIEAEAEVVGTASSSWVADATETSYRFFKVQVKSSVGGAAGTAQVRGYAKM